MKKIFTLFGGLACSAFLSAQISVFGVSPNGMNPTTNQMQREYFFNYELNSDSYNNLYEVQMSELARASENSPVVKKDGKYYGVTQFGGTFNAGQIFSYSDDDGEAILLLDFNPAVFSTQGAIYDIVFDEASNKIFVSSVTGVFEFNPSMQELTLVHLFSTDSWKNSPLVSSEGFIYYTSSNGTTSTIYQLDAANNNFTTVHNFPSLENGERLGLYNGNIIICQYNKVTMYHPLLQWEEELFTNANNFNLGFGFGIPFVDGNKMYFTAGGGTFQQGILAKYDFTNNQYDVLFNVANVLNGGSNTGVNVVKVGNEILFTSIYGSAPNSRKLFAYNIISESTTVKDSYNFAVYQTDRLLYDAAENRLVAISYGGGLADQGTLYYYDLINETFEIKINFNTALTSMSQLNLSTVRIGTKIFGNGYAHQYGTKGSIYFYDLLSEETDLIYNLPFDFQNINTIKSNNDKLYFDGYVVNNSPTIAIVEYNPQNNNFQTWLNVPINNIGNYNYCFENGTLYLITTTGNDLEFGGIYKKTAPTGNLELLYAFSNAQNLHFDQAYDMQIANNHLYFTHTYFETNNTGNILKLNLNNNQLSLVKQSENPSSDGRLYETLTHVNGQLYGTAKGGNTNNGILFRIDTGNDNFSILHHFNGLTESDNSAQKLTHLNGTLYFASLYKNITSNGIEPGNLLSFDLASNQLSILAPFETAPNEAWNAVVSVFDRCLLDTFATSLVDGVLSVTEIEGVNYEWVNCANTNNVLSTNSTFTPIVTGTYQVRTSKSTCSFTSDCIQVTISDNASLIENELANIQLFPNPASENFKLNGIKAGMTIEMLDLSGKTLWQTTTDDHYFDASVKDLQAGIYLVKIGYKGMVKTFRLVVK
jgi:hypothetical protein